MNTEMLFESVNTELETISDKWKIFNLRKTEGYFEALNTQFQIDRNQLIQNTDELNQIHVYYNKSVDSNHIIKCYENQLHYLWKRSINSESFVIQLIDILKELKDPLELIEILFKKKVVPIQMINLLRYEYKSLENLLNHDLRYKQIERTKMLKYLTDKSIETIIENINLKKRLTYLNIKLSVLENYVPINSTSASFNTIRIDCNEENNERTLINYSDEMNIQNESNKEESCDTLKNIPLKLRMKHLELAKKPINVETNKVDESEIKIDKRRSTSNPLLENALKQDSTVTFEVEEAINRNIDVDNVSLKSSLSTLTNENIDSENDSLNYLSSNLRISDTTLCTKTIATRVKEVLIQNQISQKLFGRALLKLAESTISLLLSKPKCWKILSHRGREPYYKMYLWLNDPQGIQKIKMWIHNLNHAKQTKGQITIHSSQKKIQTKDEENNFNFFEMDKEDDDKDIIFLS